MYPEYYYPTTPPDITNEAQIGDIIVAPTATPTPSPEESSSGNSSSTTASTASPTATPRQIIRPQETPSTSIIRRFIQNAFSVYGYGPANSEVTLKGFGVSERTTTDGEGFYRFSPVYSLTYLYPELCIQATDTQGRLTQPSCIPSINNVDQIPLEVGPVLLSPTISLNSNKVVKNGEAYMTGKTSPNTEVNIYIARHIKMSLVSVANAYYVPTLKTESNANGDFEFSLPTGEETNYRVFASSNYGDDISAKSNTLTFSVISPIKSWWDRVLEFLLLNKINAFVILECLVVIFLLLMTLKRTTKSHRKVSTSHR